MPRWIALRWVSVTLSKARPRLGGFASLRGNEGFDSRNAHWPRLNSYSRHSAAPRMAGTRCHGQRCQFHPVSPVWPPRGNHAGRAPQCRDHNLQPPCRFHQYREGLVRQTRRPAARASRGTTFRTVIQLSGHPKLAAPERSWLSGNACRRSSRHVFDPPALVAFCASALAPSTVPTAVGSAIFASNR